MNSSSAKIKTDIWKMILITGNFSGFSLIELIVAMGLISSIIFLGSLHFQSHLSQTLLKTSSQEVASTLRWARRLAITKRQPHKVVFQPQTGKYWIENAKGEKVEGVVCLKKRIKFANPELGKTGEEDGLVEAGIPDNAFSFYPQGTAEGGSIYLKDSEKGNWYTVTITPTTGGVTIYEEKH